MVFVKLREGEGIEEALRRFKRECERNGILKEIKRRERYLSPALKRKLKAAEARRKMRRAKRRRPFGKRAHRSVVSKAPRIFQSARRAQPIGARSVYFPRFRHRYPYRTVKTTQPGRPPVTAGWHLPTPTID